MYQLFDNHGFHFLSSSNSIGGARKGQWHMQNIETEYENVGPFPSLPIVVPKFNYLQNIALWVSFELIFKIENPIRNRFELF